MTIEERKQVCFKILRKVHEVCVDNNITYYLAYGTLLGAVRHNGFIPWDDDIDVWIPWYEIKRFCEIMKNTEYDVLFYPYHNGWDFHFVKISDPLTAIEAENGKNQFEKRGVSVDIFPIFVKGNKFWLRKVNILIKMLANYCDDSSICEGGISGRKAFALKLAKHLISEKKVYEKFDKELSLKITENTEICCLFSPYNLERDTYKGCWFVDRILTKFEDEEFYIPKGYKEILKQIYGDWETPPPAHQRNSGHFVNAYWV